MVKAETVTFGYTIMPFKGNGTKPGEMARKSLPVISVPLISRDKFAKKVFLIMNSENHNEDTIAKIKKILVAHSGSIPVYLRLRTNGTKRDFYLNQKISISDSSINELLGLLGENSLKYLSS